MTKSICMYNRKGGTGKTSLSGALACQLTLQGQKVLMIDTDTQANLTQQFLPDDEPEHELVNVLRGECDVDEAIYKTNYDNLYIMPTKRISQNGELDEWATTKAGEPKNRNKIKNLIQAVYQMGINFIIWDFAPEYTDLTQLILLASDEVIPVLRIDFFSIKGLTEFFKLLDDLKAGDEDPKFTKIIFNCRDKRITYQNDSMEQLKDFKLSKYIIPTDTGFTKSQFERKALQEFDIKKETTDVIIKLATDLISEE